MNEVINNILDRRSVRSFTEEKVSKEILDQLFSPDRFLFAEPDSYIMAHNICLAAHSIGVDSCIISVATDYFFDEFGQEILKKWDIPEDYHISAQVILGYRAGKYPAPKERKYQAPLFV